MQKPFYFNPGRGETITPHSQRARTR